VVTDQPAAERDLGGIWNSRRNHGETIETGGGAVDDYIDRTMIIAIVAETATVEKHSVE